MEQQNLQEELNELYRNFLDNAHDAMCSENDELRKNQIALWEKMRELAHAKLDESAL